MESRGPNRAKLRREGIAPTGQSDPWGLFTRWLHDWQETRPLYPSAAVLATSARDGAPSARVVNMALVANRLLFGTDARSVKGRQVVEQPRAAVCFVWLELARQVRVEGAVDSVDDRGSDALFAGLPRENQLLAWVSEQSAQAPERDQMLRYWRATQEKYPDGAVPRPATWRAYEVIPSRFEFWQERADGIHDRLSFQRGGELGWEMVRLAA